MPDGGMGTLPKTDSSVSVHPSKQTWYPPNGTFFGGRPFPFILVFAIVFVSSVSGGTTMSVAVRSFGAAQGHRAGWRSFPNTCRPPGNTDQRAARRRRDSADFLPAALAAARLSGEITRQRTQTYGVGSTTANGHRFSPQDAQTTSQARGRRWTGQPQVGQIGPAGLAAAPRPSFPAFIR